VLKQQKIVGYRFPKSDPGIDDNFRFGDSLFFSPLDGIFQKSVDIGD